MSNPFALFRKNQRTWMAALVALALLAFVVAPAITSISDAGAAAAGNNTVVVRWNSGTITAQELSVYARRLGMVESFLNKLAKKVLDAGGEPQVPGIMNPQTRQVQRYGFFRSGSLQTIGQTKLLANYARENGLELSDAAADEFLRAFCDRKISDDDIRQTMVESSNNQLSFYEVREVLKTELAALLLQQNAITGVYTSTPGALYEDFSRMNRTARVEAYPILASSFIGDVSGEPTETELQAIYDEGILRVASPNSSSPGFIKPYSANVEFIRVDFNKRVEEAKAALSEEEIKAEYDRMLALNQLQVPVTPPVEEPTEGDSATTEDAADKPEGTAEVENLEEEMTEEAGAGEAAAEDPKPAEKTEGTPEKEKAEEKAAEEKAAEEKAAEEKAAESNSGEEQTGEEKPNSTEQGSTTESKEASEGAGKSEEEPPAKESGDQAFLDPQANVKFVSLQEETAKTEDPAPETQAENASEATAEQAEPAEGSAQQEKEEAPAAAATDTPPTEPQAAESGEPAEVTPATEEGDGEEETPALPEMRNQTFEEAKEQIALSLARQKATEKVDEIFTDIRENHLLPYALEYQEYEVLSTDEVATADGAIAPPVKPDLKKLAEENGMEYGETGMLNASEASSTEIGQAQVKPDINLMLFGPVSNTVFTIGSQFSPKVNLFQPIQAGNQGNLIQFMFWKTDERPAYQPELADIRDEVVEFWRLKQAREKAKKAAEELAAKVKPDDGEPWKGVLSTAELTLVTTTDQFTAIRPTQFGVIPTPVDRLDNVGEEFMDEVFDTEVGQFSVAPNSSNDTFYVFRVTETGPAPEELLERFNNDPLKSGPKAMARETGADIFTGWIDGIEKEMGAEWQAEGLAAIN